MNRCTFSQTTKFTSLIPPHDENFEQIQCENMTDEQFDEYGRTYCLEHRNKVDEINKSRHKNCINKEKFMQYLKNTYRLNGYYAEVYKPIKTRIKDGWFDNE